jgi:hypothetical protein
MRRRPLMKAGWRLLAGIVSVLSGCIIGPDTAAQPPAASKQDPGIVIRVRLAGIQTSQEVKAVQDFIQEVNRLAFPFSLVCSNCTAPPPRLERTGGDCRQLLPPDVKDLSGEWDLWAAGERANESVRCMTDRGGWVHIWFVGQAPIDQEEWMKRYRTLVSNVLAERSVSQGASVGRDEIRQTWWYHAFILYEASKTVSPLIVPADRFPDDRPIGKLLGKLLEL